jgi:hypothetical protein
MFDTGEMLPRMLSSLSSTSLIGDRDMPFKLPVVRCVSASKVRIVSSCRPKKSKRSGAASPAG